MRKYMKTHLELGSKLDSKSLIVWSPKEPAIHQNDNIYEPDSRLREPDAKPFYSPEHHGFFFGKVIREKTLDFDDAFSFIKRPIGINIMVFS